MVHDKIRIDAAKVDQLARRIGDAVKGVAGADRANPRRSSDDVAQLGHRGRAVDAGGRESVIAGPVALARQTLASFAKTAVSAGGLGEPLRQPEPIRTG